MSDEVYGLIFVGFVLVVIVLVIIGVVSGKKYMKKQKEEGTDKRRMLDLMARVLEEKFQEFTYVVGYYTKTERYGRTTTYYYFPYIVAFNETDMIVFPFIVKEGQLYIRNHLVINWQETKMEYTANDKGIRLKLTIAGEKMPINIDKVIKSSGVEKSDRPLGIYQEAEVERLKAMLPNYKIL